MIKGMYEQNTDLIESNVVLKRSNTTLIDDACLTKPNTDK